MKRGDLGNWISVGFVAHIELINLFCGVLIVGLEHVVR